MPEKEVKKGGEDGKKEKEEDKSQEKEEVKPASCGLSSLFRRW